MVRGAEAGPGGRGHEEGGGGQREEWGNKDELVEKESLRESDMGRWGRSWVVVFLC